MKSIEIESLLDELKFRGMAGVLDRALIRAEKEGLSVQRIMKLNYNVMIIIIFESASFRNKIDYFRVMNFKLFGLLPFFRTGTFLRFRLGITSFIFFGFLES